MGDGRHTEPMDIDGNVEEVIRNDAGGNRLWAVRGTVDLRQTGILTTGGGTASTKARQAAINATSEDFNLDEQTSESSVKGKQGRKINQEGWNIKAGEDGRESFGVNGKGLPDDDIKQSGWDINGAKGSCAKYGVNTDADAPTETGARK